MKKLTFNDQLISYNIGEFIDNIDFDDLRLKLSDIEKKFAGKNYTRFYFNWDYDYDGYNNIEIFGSREESDKEFNERVELQKKQSLQAAEEKKLMVAQQADQEKRLYLKLKKKYESQ